MPKKKTYIIDTNVYLTDAGAINSFGVNDIVVPLKVLEEIDKHKKRQDGVGVNARNTIRALDKLRKKGSINDGVRIDKGLGLLRAADYDLSVVPKEWDPSDSDNQIIATALTEKLKDPDKKIISTIRRSDLALEAVDARSDIFSGGEKLDSKIVELDFQKRILRLSPKEAQKDEQASLIKKFGKNASKSGQTLASIFKKAMGKKEEK